MLRFFFDRIRAFANRFIEMKYTSVPYWRPWSDF
jgi:hypothetical protein